MPIQTVVVRFKAVGNAPIMKQNFYKITASNRFQTVIQFLRKELGWKSGEPLVCGHADIFLTFQDSSSFMFKFTYINLAFSPAPDDTVANLMKVCMLMYIPLDRTDPYASPVFSDGWSFNSKL